MENLKQYIKEVIRQEIKIVPKTQFQVGDTWINYDLHGSHKLKIITIEGDQIGYEYIGSKGSTSRGSENINKFKETIKEYGWKRQKELEEESTSGDAGAYSTPYAFKKTKNLQEKINKAIKKELINEITYGKFKNEVSQRSKAEQLHKAVREVKRKINEIDRIVEYTSRMKQELSESEGGVAYWQRTSESIKQIEEMLSQVVSKCSNLNK